MSRKPAVTVAGGGVFGLTSALALADAGCAVTVWDRGGDNASRLAAGMIGPVFEAVLDPVSRPHLDLMMTARNLWPELALRAGIALDRSGALAVGGEGWLDQVEAGLGDLGLAPMALHAETARALAPGLAMTGRRALLTREDWRVDARSALDRLAAAAAGAGVVFREGAVLERGGADILVVATGWASPHLAPELGWLAPIKGQLVRVNGSAEGAVVRGEGVYAAPGLDMVFGATMEPGLSDVDIDQSVVDPVLAAGLRLFPALRDQSFKVQAGVRAATPDGLPMVGPAVAPGVVLAAGARRNGWLLAPLVARMVLDCVTERDPGPYAAAFDPGRFGSHRGGGG